MLNSKSPSTRALTFGLVGLLAAIALAGADEQEDKEFYLSPLRPRTGLFAQDEEDMGYLKIYEEYFDNVLQKNDRALENLNVDDFRKVRPTGEMCLDFLQAFQVKDYQLSKPYDIIPLDACIGWLFDTSSQKAKDLKRFNSIAKKEHDALMADKPFRDIYENTAFAKKGVPPAFKEFLHKYMTSLLAVNAANPRNGCHSLWLDLYNDFVERFADECTASGLDEMDPYLDLVNESTKMSARNCYKIMQSQMAGFLVAAYNDESSLVGIKRGRSVWNSFSSNPVGEQAERNKWPRSLIRVLQITANADPNSAVDLGAVAKTLKAIKDGDRKVIEAFTTTLATYTKETVKTTDTSNDNNGRARYGRAMTGLCRPFVHMAEFLAATGGTRLWDEENGNERKPFEFFNLIYSLIKLTNHEQTLGLAKAQFERDVLGNHWEALYLATLACRVVSNTWGELQYETNEGQYEVKLRPNAALLLDEWPVDVIHERLAKEPESEASDAPKKKDSIFGRKFKLSLGRSPKSSRRTTPSPIPTPDDDQEDQAVASSAVQPRKRGEGRKMSLDLINKFKQVHNRLPSEIPAGMYDEMSKSGAEPTEPPTEPPTSTTTTTTTTTTTMAPPTAEPTRASAASAAGSRRAQAAAAAGSRRAQAAAAAASAVEPSGGGPRRRSNALRI